MPNPLSLHEVRQEHLRTYLRAHPEGLCLDAQTFDEYAGRGWTRAQVERTIDALLQAGEAQAIPDQEGRLCVFAGGGPNV